MTEKKRILFCGEASFLSTGFSTYYRELLPRLAATGKYEIAEFGSYAAQSDPRVQEFIAGRWKFYGVMPSNQQEAQVFNQPSPHPRTRGQNTNQFGEYKFNHVVADFKPDIVIDIRDWWMLEHQERSVFRPWYKWLIMPTVDAEPQSEEWISTYENANMVMAYSDYGIHALRRQTPELPGGRRSMKIFPKPMRPGVDIETFKPEDKTEVRDDWNIHRTAPIIGTVMRNQSRKLYPDLIDAFALMKKKYKGEKPVDDAILMLHSSWPDNMHSYDYPRHIKRLETMEWLPYAHKGIRGSVLQTLHCHTCKESSWTYAMNLHGQPVQEGRVKLPCGRCGVQDASPPQTAGGFTREGLAKLYNMFDLYVQCSICEGDGMPIQEAKSCGVPTLVTDYTAMREKGRYPDYSHFKDTGVNASNYTIPKGGETIDVGRYYHEPETSCLRAHPDVEDMAVKMRDLISDPERLAQMSVEARECVEENYDWNKLVGNWEAILDGVKSMDRAATWDSPIEQLDPIKPQAIPEGLDDDQFLEWLYIHILNYEVVDNAGAQMWKQHLEQGISRDAMVKQFVAIGNQQSDSSQAREQIRAEVAGNATVPNATSNARKQEFV